MNLTFSFYHFLIPCERGTSVGQAWDKRGTSVVHVWYELGTTMAWPWDNLKKTTMRRQWKQANFFFCRFQIWFMVVECVQMPMLKKILRIANSPCVSTTFCFHSDRATFEKKEAFKRSVKTESKQFCSFYWNWAKHYRKGWYFSAQIVPCQWFLEWIAF